MKHLIFLLIIALSAGLFTSCDERIEKLDERMSQPKPDEQYEIPVSYHGISYDGDGYLVSGTEGKLYKQHIDPPEFSANNFKNCVSGTESGLIFDFTAPEFEGKLYYGFILAENTKYPHPVYFKKSAKIKNGKAEVEIKNTFSGKYDIAGLQEKGYAFIGYRVVSSDGKFIYDGKFVLEGNGPYEVALSITEGPFINMITPSSAVLSFKTNQAAVCTVKVDGKEFYDAAQNNFHEIPLLELQPDTEYEYELIYGDRVFKSNFKSAPKEGSRKAFTFSFASDSRNGPGGGERNIYGTNAYIMKKIAALNASKNVAFFQFTGDLIDGYLSDPDETRLQYSNWKRAIEPFSSSIPTYVGMGNHEAVLYELRTEDGKERISIDKFPFDLHSAEKIFADEFVNHMNGPVSEDASLYDPDPNTRDFPSYKENVYSYIYGNTAMIVLNSNYWYAPESDKIGLTSGNLHGYIMDNQLKWLENTINDLENNVNIDHIFVTQHTPAFPNGGHASDDMWYDGDNTFRPNIAGKDVEKGIIERRDEYLKILLSSSKVLAILTGDEHNYSRLRLDDKTDIYPENWDKEELYFHRTIWHICNGSAGAPYYGQEQLPWSNSVEKFSTQYALCFFEIDGKSVNITVQDPDTYEIIEKVKLR